jgi:hypothetical protein
VLDVKGAGGLRLGGLQGGGSAEKTILEQGRGGVRDVFDESIGPLQLALRCQDICILSKEDSDVFR